MCDLLLIVPYVSVNLGSNRPGGIDVALAGLVGQTFKDFEVVFVDGLYHERHRQVLEAVKKSGLEQPFYHVPNHRYRGDIWGTTCAGYNTGFALSAGEIVVMLLDYAFAPRDWLSIHAAHQTQQQKIILGPHEYRTFDYDGMVPPLKRFTREVVDSMNYGQAMAEILAQRARIGPITSFARPFRAEDLSEFKVEESDAKCKMATGPWEDTNYFNTKNESFPLEAVLEVNGMDENYDRGRGPGDPDLCYRLRKVCKPMWIVNEAIVHAINPRSVLPNLNIVIPEDRRLPVPYDHRWYIQDGYAYYGHVKESGAYRASNPIDIRKLRNEIWGWREYSLLPGFLVEKRVISDEVYYRDESWFAKEVTTPWH